MTTHRQLDDPTDTEIRTALATRDSAIVDLALQVRAFVRETLPEVREALDAEDGMLGFGAKQYGADDWGIATPAAYSRWVSLGFTDGKRIRHVKLRSSGELDDRREPLRGLLPAAAGRIA